MIMPSLSGRVPKTHRFIRTWTVLASRKLLQLEHLLFEKLAIVLIAYRFALPKLYPHPWIVLSQEIPP